MAIASSPSALHMSAFPGFCDNKVNELGLEPTTLKIPPIMMCSIVGSSHNTGIPHRTAC